MPVSSQPETTAPRLTKAWGFSCFLIFKDDGRARRGRIACALSLAAPQQISSRDHVVQRLLSFRESRHDVPDVLASFLPCRKEPEESQPNPTSKRRDGQSSAPCGSAAQKIHSTSTQSMFFTITQ
jgi:hypothetical protein